MKRRWVGSRESGKQSGELRERDEDGKVSGRRKGRMELGQMGKLEGWR